MTAFLMVRAIVPPADRSAFENWYETEHLPDAKAAFRALSAQRGWSDIDAGIHFALYEFADLPAARAIADSDEIKDMIAEFDRVWQDRVDRVREVIEIRQKI